MKSKLVKIVMILGAMLYLVFDGIRRSEYIANTLVIALCIGWLWYVVKYGE